MVHQRRATVEAPSLHELPGMATADEEAIEGHPGGLRVEEAEDPVRPLPVGKEGYGRGAGVFAHYESGMRGRQESTSREDGGGERKGGWPRPALECTFRLSFPFGGWRDGSRFLFIPLFFSLSLSFSVGGDHYDRLGRSARMLGN